MRVKIFWFIALIFSLSLLGCDLVNDTTASLLNPPKRTPLPERYWDLWTEHSPNGKWDVHFIHFSPIETTLVITSTITNSSFQDDFELGIYNHLTSWFPDNSGFVLFDAEKGCQKCSWDKLIVYHINEDSSSFSHFIFEPLSEPNRAFWHTPTWSDDESKFAVIVGGDIGGERIYILDQKATILHEISPKLSTEEIIDRVIWVGDDLVYTVRNLEAEPSEPEVTEIRMAHLDKKYSDELILRSASDYPHILSVSPENDYLLISRTFLGSQTGEISVFDLEESRFTKTIYRYDSYPSFEKLAPHNQHIIGFQLHNINDNLFVFDWETQELTDTQIAINLLLGWQDEQNAFITFRSDSTNPEEKWIELISP